jgi:solute carrier family 25 (mitochondrial phosphate transporter), member 23/24/25/41
MSFLRPFFAMLFLVGQRPPPPRSPSSWDVVESSRSTADIPSTLSSRTVKSPVTLLPEVTAAEPDVLPASDWTEWPNIHTVLIGCVPSTGYFAAGAVAGIVSRTATAPLDRLKVYLIAQTKVSTNTLAASHGVFGLLNVAIQNTTAAVKDLWRAGGMRSLYAGKNITCVNMTNSKRKWHQHYQGHARDCNTFWLFRGLHLQHLKN